MNRYQEKNVENSDKRHVNLESFNSSKQQ